MKIDRPIRQFASIDDTLCAPVGAVGRRSGRFQPYPWTALTILHEDDAGRLEGASDDLHDCAIRACYSTLELADLDHSDFRRIRQLPLRPVDKTSSGAALGGNHHP
jgi:hypothetical protein